MVSGGLEWSGRFRRKPCSDRHLLRFLPVFEEWRRGESNLYPVLHILVKQGVMIDRPVILGNFLGMKYIGYYQTQ